MTYRAQVDFDNIVLNANPAVAAYTNNFQAPNCSFQEIAGAWTRAQASTTSYVYRHFNLSGGARAVLAGQMRGDQIVEADLRPTEFSGTDRWVGLVARYRDDSNYHYVTLLVSVPFTVQTNVSYRMRLETIGTLVRVYVNGVLRAEATDASAAPAGSGMGLATYKATVDADNVLVTQP